MTKARTSISATLGRSVLVLGLCVAVTGCATQRLNSARTQFYSGHLDQAEESLYAQRSPKRDRVLFLMEQGTVRQARGDYERSSRDFIDAYDRLVELETYSVSRGAGSLVVNDTIRSFVGAPFERTLLHAVTAQNHLSLGHWDNAAVEARRIMQSLADENRRNYPDEPYSRYMAGLALELIDDPSNAALQYRRANELLPHLEIDPATGRLSHAQPPDDDEEIHGAWPILPATDSRPPPPDHDHELIVVVQLGRSPHGWESIRSAPNHTAPVYAEIHADGDYLGRTYNLSDVAALMAETKRVTALRDAGKAVARFAAKEGIAVAVESSSDSPWAGDLVRLILFGLLEQPDDRRWETLPRYFQIARVPAPSDLSSYTVVVKGSGGNTIRSFDVDGPLQRRRHQIISFARDITGTPPALKSSEVPSIPTQ